jgi:anti-sigma regulatory factor (Ser/Thr protein kinase)
MFLIDFIREAGMGKAKTKEIHDFILENIQVHSTGIAALVSERFGISRQAANRHLQHLQEAGMVDASGNRRNKHYSLKPKQSKHYEFALGQHLQEHVVWLENIKPVVSSAVGKNTYNILNYGFSEILNNAIDHSEGTSVQVSVEIFPKTVKLIIQDDGVGIFNKIQNHFKLDDPRHALLELSKGKLTSDPEHHTGEGIFFTCRMFDSFFIWSHFLSFLRHSNDDWLLEDRSSKFDGTLVGMEIARETDRTTTHIFEEYATEANEYGFTRTHVLVNLALYEGEILISRSQAKRLLARVDRFKEVLLDFKGVTEIGPAFADEIFRVFAKAHPGINLPWINAGEFVERMINRATANGNS